MAEETARPVAEGITEEITHVELRHSPINDQHIGLGAKMADFGGWSMPIEYPGGGVLKEHAAVREAVGLFDVSHLGKLKVTGAGAIDFVNAQLTNDILRIAPGKAQYSMLCNDNGGVVDDLIVYWRADDDVLVIPNASNSAQVLATLESVAPPSIALANQHQDFGVLAVQGPRSQTVLSDLGLGVELDYMEFADAQWRGSPLTICRTGYSGELGYELLPTWEQASELWDALLPAVTESGGRPVGLGARDTLRTEMGYPLHGQDLSPEISPVQARLGWAVGWDKPQFRGRDALLDEKRAGPARRLWGLSATDRGIPRPHMQVMTADGEPVGEVTSGTFSPTLRRGIGLALLADPLGSDDSVTVDIRGRPSTMTVVRPPFVAASTRS